MNKSKTTLSIKPKPPEEAHLFSNSFDILPQKTLNKPICYEKVYQAHAAGLVFCVYSQFLPCFSVLSVFQCKIFTVPAVLYKKLLKNIKKC